MQTWLSPALYALRWVAEAGRGARGNSGRFGGHFGNWDLWRRTGLTWWLSCGWEKRRLWGWRREWRVGERGEEEGRAFLSTNCTSLHKYDIVLTYNVFKSKLTQGAPIKPPSRGKSESLLNPELEHRRNKFEVFIFLLYLSQLETRKLEKENVIFHVQKESKQWILGGSLSKPWSQNPVCSLFTILHSIWTPTHYTE